MGSKCLFNIMSSLIPLNKNGGSGEKEEPAVVPEIEIQNIETAYYLQLINGYLNKYFLDNTLSPKSSNYYNENDC